MDIRENLIPQQDKKVHYPPEDYTSMVEQQRKAVCNMVGAVNLPGHSPNIKIIPGQLHVATDEAEAILIANRPEIFQRCGKLVRIVSEAAKPEHKSRKKQRSKPPISRAEGALVIIDVDPVYLSETLGKLASWTKLDERSKSWKAKDCPEKIAKTLLARHQWGLSVLAGIIQAPTLRPDGSILQTPGYDDQTGLFYDPGATSFPPILETPCLEDAIAAKENLLALLSEFPFESEEDKSVALSGILTSLVRKSIRTAPIHCFTAPKMGAGKSLLADVIGLIATGRSNCVISQADSEAEEEKRLITVLGAGDAVVCYDNIERPFGCAPLCSVLSQEMFKGRLLCTNKHINLATNATFLATGNNLTLIGDVSTRAILCRLNPLCERPEERTFEINLYHYIPGHRGNLAKDALTILRAYHVVGRPKQNIKQFGRFEEWSDWIRSALIWVGMEDPCKSRREIESTDPVRLSLSAFLKAFHATFDDVYVQGKSILNTTSEDLKEALMELIPNREKGVNEIVLGRALQKHIKRIEGGLQLEREPDYQGRGTWRVVKVDDR